MNKTVGLKDRRQKVWMGGRAVDCDGLENRCGGNSTGGSNPSPSASILGFAMNSTKIPQNRGIFHALTVVWNEIWGFFSQNIRHSIQCPFLLSQWYKKPPRRCPGVDFGIGCLATIECRFLFAEVAISFGDFEQGLQIYVRGYFTI